MNITEDPLSQGNFTASCDIQSFTEQQEIVKSEMAQPEEPAVDAELYELWSQTEDLIDEIKAKVNRAGWRIGTTIEMKNDKKRVEETYDLIREYLDDLSEAYYVESGKLKQQMWKHKHEVDN